MVLKSVHPQNCRFVLDKTTGQASEIIQHLNRYTEEHSVRSAMLFSKIKDYYQGQQQHSCCYPILRKQNQLSSNF